MKDATEPPAEAVKRHPVLAGDDDFRTSTQPLLVEDETEAESAPSQEADAEDESAAASDRSYEMEGPAWKGYVFAALPLVACLSGGCKEPWAKGLATILLAVVLICFAPQRRLPRLMLGALLAALLAPLLSFLPQSWFAMDAWRASLMQDWGLQLSKTLTPQAGVTLEAWFVYAPCCLWLSWCLMRGFSEVQRRTMMLTLTFGGVGLCLMAVLEGKGWLAVPWWPRNQYEWGEPFGPFANRNHTSTLAAMTCVMCAAAAYDAHKRKSRLWMPVLLGMLPPLMSIYMNSSRAGLILVFLGMTTWLGTIAMRRGFFQKMAVSASLIFIISTLLILSGGDLSKRLSTRGLEDFASDHGRSSVFAESLMMTMHTPWTGIGLGNFESVFPHFAHLHAARFRYVHPESDLLWLLAEGGLLTLLPGVLVVFWIAISTGPWFGKKKKRKSGMQDRRLRNAAAIVFGLGAVHGLGDVPNHGYAFAMLMALLAGIAVRPRRLPEAAGPVERATLRLCGVAVLVLGAAWMAVALGHPVLPGKNAADTLRNRALKLADSGSPAGALPLINAAIEKAPLDFRYYYDRACLRLRLGQPKESALDDFSLSRALDPLYAMLCFSEGLVWLDYDPQLSVVGWREFLNRYPETSTGEHGFYRQMLGYSYHYPALREPLWSLATKSELKFEFLRTVQSKEEFQTCLQSLLSEQVPGEKGGLQGLKVLNPVQRENLFTLWYQLGDQKALISALENTPAWRDDGWRILAEHYAKNSEFQRACQTAMPYLPPIVRTSPGTNTDIPSLERALIYDPTDIRRAIELFQAQKTQGDTDGAIRTLQRVSALPNPPAYVRQELAALYMTKQDFRRAWENLREAMQKPRTQE